MTHEHSTSGRPDAPSGVPAHPTGGPPDTQAGIPANLTTGPPDALSGIPAPPVPEAEAGASGPAPGAPPAGFHKRPALGYALYLTGALLFGINGTVSKVLLHGRGQRRPRLPAARHVRVPDPAGRSSP